MTITPEKLKQRLHKPEIFVGDTTLAISELSRIHLKDSKYSQGLAVGKDIDIDHNCYKSIAGNEKSEFKLYHEGVEICRINPDGSYFILKGLRIEFYLRALGDALAALTSKHP